MPLYIFYPSDEKGRSTTFVVRELASDAETAAVADALMREHPHCFSVIVWDGDRRVRSLERV